VLGTGEVQTARGDYVADHNIVGPGRAWRCRIIEQDFTREQRRDFTVRKQVLWESDSATDAEVRSIELAHIRELRSNDPAILRRR
jgi:hypothetical protein